MGITDFVKFLTEKLNQRDARVRVPLFFCFISTSAVSMVSQTSDIWQKCHKFNVNIVNVV